ncbi:iron-sulfur cluster co-chaperone protein HscB isoform X2 [Brachionichthys hirsutus]|uniref:iron-sulfur cluster co-chaperone protein HscB isoform X2 n=1 Tax=Brachionichthys hirsutus TaxID=412623 RepID=UPI0036053BCC
MLPVNSSRTVYLSRALLRSFTVNLTCSARCISSSLFKKETWHSNTNLKQPGREKYLVYSVNKVNHPRHYSTTQVKLGCWNCKKPLVKTPAFFCKSCNVIQPPEEGTSLFEIMDCERTFTLDTQKLQTRFVQLQRFLHPDKFSQKSVKEQEYSEIQSALVNKAYKTLLKPLSRGLYMLELKGMSIEEGTDSGADSEFLMELMAINEVLDDAKTPEEADKIGRDTKRKLADLTKEIDTALLRDLQAAKALLAQMKYYANIEEKVKEKVSQFM